mgnify:CR=1 FL=1
MNKQSLACLRDNPDFPIQFDLLLLAVVPFVTLMARHPPPRRIQNQVLYLEPERS